MSATTPLPRFGPRPRRRTGRLSTERYEGDEQRPRGRGRARGRSHGHHHDGPGFGPGRGRRRAARGNVRAAVLSLLAEQPMHGYAVLGQLAERSGGLWRPSPGSVYPVLGQLEEEGLVTATEADGRRIFSLTDEGRAYVAEHADELREPWSQEDLRHRDRAAGLFQAVRSLGGAAREVARSGTDRQVAAAQRVLDDARRSLYRLLSEEPSDPPPPPGTTARDTGE